MSYFSCRNCGSNQFVANSVGVFCDFCGTKHGSKAPNTTGVLDIFKEVIEAAMAPLLRDQMGGQAVLPTKCDICGTTWNDIYTSGRMGCAKDYELFAEELRPWLIKAHGCAKHKTKRDA